SLGCFVHEYQGAFQAQRLGNFHHLPPRHAHAHDPRAAVDPQTDPIEYLLSLAPELPPVDGSPSSQRLSPQENILANSKVRCLVEPLVDDADPKFLSVSWAADFDRAA